MADLKRVVDEASPELGEAFGQKSTASLASRLRALALLSELAREAAPLLDLPGEDREGQAGDDEEWVVDVEEAEEAEEGSLEWELRQSLGLFLQYCLYFSRFK